jgi:hypothetical protein
LDGIPQLKQGFKELAGEVKLEVGLEVVLVHYSKVQFQVGQVSGIVQ